VKFCSYRKKTCRALPLQLALIMEKEYEATYKILILGDSSVGKTCLIFRFIEDVFSDSYISTIGKLLQV